MCCIRRHTLAWEHEAYSSTWEHHTEEVLKHFNNRILLIPVEFLDESKLDALATFLGCTPVQMHVLTLETSGAEGRI